MKFTHYLPGMLICLSMNALSVKAQDNLPDSTGLPGDNFSLQGALEMFKKAGSPEEFEKLINSEDNKVNNLDLNGDGNIDYVKVINKRENDVQVFVLQALVSDKESQDVAVIELQKNGADNAVVQIVGDEDIYGEQTIVEPEEEGNSYQYESLESSLAKGPNMEPGMAYNSNAGIVVNVWFWPCVRYVYAPSYVVWVSPWTWYSRPVWWRPWRPLAWTYYRPFRVRYYPHYAVVRTHRVVYASRIYRPTRVTSVTVRTRNQVAVTHYRTTHNVRVARTTTTVRPGNRVQPSRRTTTVQGPRGNTRTTTTVQGNQGTRRTTTVQGSGGRVSHSKTTVRKRKP